MIVMIFEYWLADEHKGDYVQEAQSMWQLVNEIDGFISLERFNSTTDPDKKLTIGIFRDEEAVARWRNLPEHRRAQALGRSKFFKDYRLRMADLKRDYGMKHRDEIPDDSEAYHHNKG
mgnify:CR=1 FL=1